MAEAEKVKVEHPAKFSDPILATMYEVIAIGYDLDEPLSILDPFGGVGGIHSLAPESVAWETYAIELEPEWASVSAEYGWTWCGDFMDFEPNTSPFIREDSAGQYMHRQKTFDVIATSPAYGNRMADHHNAQDDSRRLTYRHRLGRDLTENNSGGMQWGDEYRAFHHYAWRKVARMLPLNGLFLLNVKDHVRRGKMQQVPQWHRDKVQHFGFVLEQDIHVPVRGMGFGANQQTLKVDYEHVYVFRKDVQ